MLLIHFVAAAQEFAKLRANRALRAYVPSCLKLLRAYLPKCSHFSCAYVPTCLRAYVP